MASTISEILKQFKSDVCKIIKRETIEQTCRLLGYVWRNRSLPPAETVHCFLYQILHGNVSISNMRRMIGSDCTSEAYCKARSRLPIELFEQLHQFTCAKMLNESGEHDLWNGHRTWAMDGSGFSMPDTPELQNKFGQPGNQAQGCGFPGAHLLCLFHHSTGLLLHMELAPLRTHDQAHASRLHSIMKEGDILLGDRGFASFVHLALLSKGKMHGVFRVHQKQIVNFRPGRRCNITNKVHLKGRPRSRWICSLGTKDQLVEYFKPTSKPKWMGDEAYSALPVSLVVREMSYKIPGQNKRTKVITLVTTLLNPERYSASSLAKLYESRWQVETNFRHLKIAMAMDVLHCKTVKGICKELHAFILIYNLVRLAMLKSAKQQKASVHKISFLDALTWLRFAKTHTNMPTLKVNPRRLNRCYPRTRKRRPKNFPLMKAPRSILPKPFP